MPWRHVISRNILIDNKLKFIEDIYFEDDEYLARVIYYLKEISFLEDPIYMYFQRTGSITRSYEITKILKSYLYLLKSLKDFRDLKVEDNRYKSYLNYYILQKASQYLNHRVSLNLKNDTDITNFIKINPLSSIPDYNLYFRVKYILIKYFPLFYSKNIKLFNYLKNCFA